MSLEDLGNVVAAVGAAIAAATGLWNLRLLLSGKRDRFVVRLGSVSPTIAQESAMHVVSHSDHPINLTDWGFIEADGRFNSFRMAWETGGLQNEQITSCGSSEIERFGAYFETGYVRNDTPLGAYAISITQHRPTLCFDSEMPYWRRLWIRLRLLFQPRYLAW